LFPLEIRTAAEEASATRARARVVVRVGPLTRFLRATATPAGDSGSVLLVVRDVTESRRLDAIRRDFVANASHELKTPAASIQAAAETLRHAAEDDPVAVTRFAAQLEREAVRLSRIVADLLDLSRLEAGSELADEVRLDAVVREEEQRYREQADAAGLVLRVDAPHVPPIRGSSRDLSLLVRNLIDNAIRYTKTGGHVDIAVSSEDAHVVVRVSDTGVGIPGRDLARVFERFYRVDRARSRETGGTGLGLAIVKHVAENHGGAVTVESELGRGSVFTVRIPSAT
jgi:two-component system sensor histidine kinase SenX3